MEMIIADLRNYTLERGYNLFNYITLRRFVEKYFPSNYDEIIYKLEEEGYITSENGVYKLMPKDAMKGIVEKSYRGNYYISYEGIRYSVNTDKLNGALPYDNVVFVIKDNKAEVLKILKRRMPNVFCEIKQDEFGKYILEPKRIKGNLNIRVSQDTLAKIGAGKYVLAKVSNKMRLGAFDGEITKQINLDGEIDDQLAMIAFANNFDVEFSKEAMMEAESIPDEPSQEEIARRKDNDFRDELVFTIDGPGTKDLDDAVSLKTLPNGNYELGVHIANVSYYLRNCPHLREEARLRCTSLYMLNTVIPMLPEKLSNGICSLNPGVDRLTKSFIMEIDKDGNVVRIKICDGVIKSAKKMNKLDVNKILEENIVPASYEKFVDILFEMEKLSKILGEKMRKDGALDFFGKDFICDFDEDGNIVSVDKRSCGKAEKLIERFMITPNVTVAGLAFRNDFPFSYRVLEGPQVRKLKEAFHIIESLGFRINESEILCSPKLIKYVLDRFKNEEIYPVLSKLLLGSMNKAKYSVVNIGHFALAVAYYGQVTSPIRRVTDLENHFNLDEFGNFEFRPDDVDKFRVDERKKELSKICELASIKEREANHAEYEAERLKVLMYLKSLIGTSFEATIDMISSKEVSITTANGISGTIKYKDILGDTFEFRDNKYYLVGRRTKRKYKIGNRVVVTVKSVNDLDESVGFTLDKNLSRAKAEEKLKHVCV